MVIKMNDDKILNLLYAALEDQDIWFTTKNDPTFAEAPSYYKLNEYGELTKEAKKQIVKDIKSYIGDGAVDEVDAVDMWVNENLANFKITFKDNLVTKFKQKPVVDQIDAYEVSMENKSSNLNESVKARLKEENDKSANVISAMFTSSDFDADSKDGKIVMKTSDLFNTLSDKGYDVQVAFDNGESQSVILLGDQGGQINVTINNPDQPLRAFASGNFEITQDTLRTMEDVLNLIKNVK